ncbi:hypothetical protein DY000_02050049 [Brassica cretica]|uniref:Uncharacterized protein n=1 Tax=Brassica cretica TaxID=69181 RepID=A0ABQ7EWT5_BRACR|nr:hypothetical protein DY000_02050049 [Brassica cretica]
MLAESMLVDFHLRQMNSGYIMTAVGGNTAGPVDAVVNVYVNHEKFAFVEM